MKKKKARFSSLSTPGLKQDVSNYLTELAFLRSNRQIKLPPKFWQQTKYKFRYRREIQEVRKFIKKYGEARVLSVAISSYITTWTDYAQIEAALQKIVDIEDLRAKHGMSVSKKEPKGLFDKFKEYKDG